MTRQEFMEKHWRFYSMLEEKFTNALRYVELDEKNFETFSMEFVSQIREIGSEIDIVLKELLNFSQDERKNISDYVGEIDKKYPDMFNRKIMTQNLTITPFDGLDKEKPAELEWWKAYNHIKHGRVLNYKEANLQNTLLMLATLYMLEMYLLKKSVKENESDIVEKDSGLFRILDWKTNYLPLNRMSAKISDETLSMYMEQIKVVEKEKA